MSFVQALLELLFVVSLFRPSWQSGMHSGPYDITVEQISACRDIVANSLNLSFNPYFKNVDGVRQLLYKGSFTFPFNKTLSKAIEVQADFYQKKTNDFLFIYKYKENMCKSVKEITYKLFYDFLEKIGVKPGGCPFDAGNYSFVDWNIQVKLPFPVLEYGTFKVVVKWLLDEEVLQCIETVSNVKRKF